MLLMGELPRNVERLLMSHFASLMRICLSRVKKSCDWFAVSVALSVDEDSSPFLAKGVTGVISRSISASELEYTFQFEPLRMLA